jgi:putative transposase
MGRQKRHTEEQIISILKEVDAGKKPKDVCRERGISEKTYYTWKAKFGGMTVSDARRLRALEDENRKLKSIVADLTLDNRALKEINSKNW